jgi:ABC-type transport system substrate-binding protein
MNDAGLRKDSNGLYVNASGQRFAPDFRGDAGGQFERELAAIAEGWRRAGVETQQNHVPTTMFSNGEYRSTFPAFYSVATGSGIESYFGHFSAGAIPSPTNRWIGQNRGAWLNAEYDALWSAFNATLDRGERTRQIIRMEQIISEELPIIMLWHNFHVIAHAAAVTGPDTRGLRDLAVWNLHEWQMR